MITEHQLTRVFPGLFYHGKRHKLGALCYYFYHCTENSKNIREKQMSTHRKRCRRFSQLGEFSTSLFYLLRYFYFYLIFPFFIGPRFSTKVEMGNTSGTNLGTSLIITYPEKRLENLSLCLARFFPHPKNWHFSSNFFHLFFERPDLVGRTGWSRRGTSGGRSLMGRSSERGSGFGRRRGPRTTLSI